MKLIVLATVVGTGPSSRTLPCPFFCTCVGSSLIVAAFESVNALGLPSFLGGQKPFSTHDADVDFSFHEELAQYDLIPDAFYESLSEIDFEEEIVEQDAPSQSGLGAVIVDGVESIVESVADSVGKLWDAEPCGSAEYAESFGEYEYDEEDYEFDDDEVYEGLQED